MIIIKINEYETQRVLNGEAGMTFVADSFTNAVDGTKIVHVRDYRFPNKNLKREFQIWSIPQSGYSIINE